MADRDAALHARRDRPLGDVAKLGRAGLAAVVQMNVDALAEAFGEAEDDVELALDVAVEACRVEAADEVGAGAERRGHEVGRAFFRGHAALREGDELNVDPVPVGLAHTQHALRDWRGRRRCRCRRGCASASCRWRSAFG